MDMNMDTATAITGSTSATPAMMELGIAGQKLEKQALQLAHYCGDSLLEFKTPMSKLGTKKTGTGDSGYEEYTPCTGKKRIAHALAPLGGSNEWNNGNAHFDILTGANKSNWGAAVTRGVVVNRRSYPMEYEQSSAIPASDRKPITGVSEFWTARTSKLDLEADPTAASLLVQGREHQNNKNGKKSKKTVRKPSLTIVGQTLDHTQQAVECNDEILSLQCKIQEFESKYGDEVGRIATIIKRTTSLSEYKILASTEIIPVANSYLLDRYREFNFLLATNGMPDVGFSTPEFVDDFFESSPPSSDSDSKSDSDPDFVPGKE